MGVSYSASATIANNEHVFEAGSLATAARLYLSDENNLHIKIIVHVDISPHHVS
jgi:hypothetical protein